MLHLRSFTRPLIPALGLLLMISSCRTGRAPSTSYVSQSRQDYISKYSPWAVDEMKRTGIPASITMAQGILESGDGNSTLARKANNHFGIKCHSDWKGKSFRHDDDKRNECFRKYNSAMDSYRDHSDFLTGKQRYASLFDLKPTDYKAWAKGLKKAGYATHPEYAGLLIKIIESNELYRLDSGDVPTQAQPAKPDSVGVSTGATTAAATAAAGSGSTSFSNEFNIPSGERKLRNINRIEYVLARTGDTYNSISREFEKMPWELPKYNEQDRDAELFAGQIIFLQPKRKQAEKGFDHYVVKDGENLWWISQLYGIKLASLRTLNELKEGEEPGSGTKLILRKSR